MVFASMKGKLLHLYEHNYQVKMKTLELVVQTPPNGSFDHEILVSKILIWHIGMQQGPHLMKVAFIPTIWMLDFIISE